MANYPQEVRLNNDGVILELIDETPINTFSSQEISFGYIRQLGDSAHCGNIDDYVQYRVKGGLPFIQNGINFIYLTVENIIFRQREITAP